MPRVSVVLPLEILIYKNESLCVCVCVSVCTLCKSTCVHQSGPNFGPRGRFLAHRGYRRSVYWPTAGGNRTSWARSGLTVRDIKLLMK